MKTEIEITEEIVRELNAEERAAARTMLAALKALFDMTSDVDCIDAERSKARAAIAQAEAAGIKATLAPT